MNLFKTILKIIIGSAIGYILFILLIIGFIFGIICWKAAFADGCIKDCWPSWTFGKTGTAIINGPQYPTIQFWSYPPDINNPRTQDCIECGADGILWLEDGNTCHMDTGLRKPCKIKIGK